MGRFQADIVDELPFSSHEQASSKAWLEKDGKRKYIHPVCHGVRISLISHKYISFPQGS